MEYAVSLKNLSKWFASPHDPQEICLAVDRVSLEVPEGELLAIVGPSSCGKSTILRMIAGLEHPTEGEIYVAGRRVDGIPPSARNIGFMFQGYSLFKHMTVADNISFGLKVKRMPSKARNRRLEELIALMHLEGLEGRRPDQLSGAQQQRVALARTLAPRPRILLLDEPFGSLDAEVRRSLGADMRRWQRELKIPTILVTHDQSEAMALGDRVAVLNEGRFEQVDTSRQVYDNPATAFVAQFIAGVRRYSPSPDGSQPAAVGLPNNAIIHPKAPTTGDSNGHSPKDQSHLLETFASHSFLGRTVHLKSQLRSGRTLAVALPKHHGPANALNPGLILKNPPTHYNVISLEEASQIGSNDSKDQATALEANQRE